MASAARPVKARAVCISSAPNGTSRAVSITSCADAPGVRAIRVHRVSICRWTIRFCVFSPAIACAAIMDRLKMPEGEAIEAGIVTRSIESAQRKVEARNFDIRKQLLEYDDVSNDQRKVIYQQRNELLEATDVAETDYRHAPEAWSPR
jgi:hypothetical protein